LFHRSSISALTRGALLQHNLRSREEEYLDYSAAVPPSREGDHLSNQRLVFWLTALGRLQLRDSARFARDLPIRPIERTHSFPSGGGCQGDWRLGFADWGCFASDGIGQVHALVSGIFFF